MLIYGEENDIQQQLLCEVGFGVQEAISGKPREVMQCNAKQRKGLPTIRRERERIVRLIL
jgi:hypothetical protein